jgi:hypothetical protein
MKYTCSAEEDQITEWAIAELYTKIHLSIQLLENRNRSRQMFAEG